MLDKHAHRKSDKSPIKLSDSISLLVRRTVCIKFSVIVTYNHGQTSLGHCCNATNHVFSN